MKSKSVYQAVALWGALVASTQAAVIATNTFEGAASTTNSATKAWAYDPGDTSGATLGNIFSVTPGNFRAAGGVDSGANLTLATTPTSPVAVSVTFTITTTASAVDLSSFAFRYYSSTNAGNNQLTLDRTTKFDLDILSPTDVSIFSAPLSITATDFVGGNSGNPYAQVNFDLSSGADLAAGSTYTVKLTAVTTDTSGFITYDNFVVGAVPEPSAALLGALGGLALLRRRRA